MSGFANPRKTSRGGAGLEESRMSNPDDDSRALRSWVSVSEKIQSAIKDLGEEGLDLRGGADGWSIRETVHHLVESNLIAANIMIAALSQSGCIYDWSWVQPDAGWMERLAYKTAPIEPALAALRGLCEHFAELIKNIPAGFEREVRLLDAPGAKPYSKTVRELVAEQVEHVQGHVGTVREIRAAHGR
jgi:hypothetical protein